MKISKFSIDLDLTFQGHQRSKVMVPKRRLYMNYYKCSIVTMVMLNRKGNTGHQSYSDLDLTFQSYPRSKFTVPKERSYMDCYKSLIVTKVVLCTVREL